MKKTILLIAILLASKLSFALEIHQIRISEISSRAINISLDTEATELYYFHSWRSQISGNTITIEAFYIEGFGSTIAYLNNNFEIPINTKRRKVYQLNIRIFYTSLRVSQNSGNLQDQWSGLFSTPLAAPIFLTEPIENNPLHLKYQNPNPGFISVGAKNVTVTILDDSGKIIESKQIQESIYFSHLPDGLYYFRFVHGNAYTTIPVILKK